MLKNNIIDYLKPGNKCAKPKLLTFGNICLVFIWITGLTNPNKKFDRPDQKNQMEKSITITFKGLDSNSIKQYLLDVSI